MLSLVDNRVILPCDKERNNILHTKKFNEYVDNLDAKNEPKYLQKYTGKDYETQRQMWISGILAWKDMRKDGLSIFDLFYKNDKPTIYGKAMGFGSNEQESKELSRLIKEGGFLDPVVALKNGEKEAYLLLDSTEFSVAEFKEKWLIYLKDKKIRDAKNEQVRIAKIQKENKEIAEHNAKILEKEREKKFTPIQGESQNKQTYDINKDAKFKYLQKKLEFKQRDVEILDLIEALQKKYGVDKKV